MRPVIFHLFQFTKVTLPRNLQMDCSKCSNVLTTFQISASWYVLDMCVNPCRQYVISQYSVVMLAIMWSTCIRPLLFPTNKATPLLLCIVQKACNTLQLNFSTLNWYPLLKRNLFAERMTDSTIQEFPIHFISVICSVQLNLSEKSCDDV